MHEMETETSGASSSGNQKQKFGGTEAETPCWVPTNCVYGIFSFLSRDELETARLVCRTWNALIVGETGQKQYQKRQLQAVEISSNYEFSVRAYCNRKLKLLTFKKYFCHCDLSTVEEHSAYQISGAIAYNYPCPHTFCADRKLNSRFKFSSRAISGFRAKFCSQKKLRIYNRHVTYRSKIFTPPLDFYIRLKWLLEHSDIKYLVFVDFAFTEHFVEKFEEFFGLNYNVGKLFIHNCSLKHISCSTFHHFIGRVVKAQEYHLELLKNALPNHINDDLLQLPNIVTAKVFMVTGAATRRPPQPDNGHPPNFNVTPQGFKNLLETREALVKEDPSTVFAIQCTSGNRQELVAEYEREYKRLDAPAHFFKYVIFGRHKFLAPDGDFIIFPTPPPNVQIQNIEEEPDQNNFPPPIRQFLQQINQENEEDDEEPQELPKQRITLLNRIVFEDNHRKEKIFDMFKPLNILS